MGAMFGSSQRALGPCRAKVMRQRHPWQPHPCKAAPSPSPRGSPSQRGPPLFGKRSSLGSISVQHPKRLSREVLCPARAFAAGGKSLTCSGSPLAFERPSSRPHPPPRRAKSPPDQPLMPPEKARRRSLMSSLLRALPASPILDNAWPSGLSRSPERSQVPSSCLRSTGFRACHYAGEYPHSCRAAEAARSAFALARPSRQPRRCLS